MDLTLRELPGGFMLHFRESRPTLKSCDTRGSFLKCMYRVDHDSRLAEVADLFKNPTRPLQQHAELSSVQCSTIQAIISTFSIPHDTSRTLRKPPARLSASGGFLYSSTTQSSST